MSLDRRSLLGLAAASLAPPVWAASRPDPTEIIRLWPDGAPGSERVTVKLDVFERSPTPDLFKDRAATGVTDPVLTVFRPPNPDGSAVLIVPGGGYKRVVIDKEGFEAARVLVAAGVTCFVLRYRLPGDGWAAGPGAPAEDARQAMRVIRAVPASIPGVSASWASPPAATWPRRSAPFRSARPCRASRACSIRS